MIKHVWSVLCRKSIIDNESNLISLIEAFEQLDVDIDKKKLEEQKKSSTSNIINISGIDYEIVTLFTRDSVENTESTELKIVVEDPDKVKINESLHKFNFTKGLYRMRYRTRISGIAITKPGIYYYSVFCKQNNEKEYTQIAALPVQVVIKYV